MPIQKHHNHQHLEHRSINSNIASGTEVPSKTRVVPAEPKKSSRKTLLKVNNSDVSPMIVDSPKPPSNPAIGSKGDDTTDNVAPTTNSTKQSDITSNDEKNDTTTTEPEPTTPATPKDRSQSPEPVEHKKLLKTQQASDVGDSHESNTGAQHPTGPHTDNHQQYNGNGAPSNSHGNNQPPPTSQQ